MSATPLKSEQSACSTRGLELAAWNLRLADDSAKSPDSQFLMIRNRYSDSLSFISSLHDDMAASASYLGESVTPQDGTDLLA